MGGKGDVARLFVDACRKHGIRPGFYHGSVNNAFLNVHGARVGKPSGLFSPNPASWSVLASALISGSLYRAAR